MLQLYLTKKTQCIIGRRCFRRHGIFRNVETLKDQIYFISHIDSYQDFNNESIIYDHYCEKKYKNGRILSEKI